MREMWEAAEALRALGLWVAVEVTTGTLTVYRDDLYIGKLTFPVDAG